MDNINLIAIKTFLCVLTHIIAESFLIIVVISFIAKKNVDSIRKSGWTTAVIYIIIIELLKLFDYEYIREYKDLISIFSILNIMIYFYKFKDKDIKIKIKYIISGLIIFTLSYCFLNQFARLILYIILLTFVVYWFWMNKKI